VRDGANWFAYVHIDPVNWTEPWGLSATDRANEKGLKAHDAIGSFVDGVIGVFTKGMDGYNNGVNLGNLNVKYKDNNLKLSSTKKNSSAEIGIMFDSDFSNFSNSTFGINGHVRFSILNNSIELFDNNQISDGKGNQPLPVPVLYTPVELPDTVSTSGRKDLQSLNIPGLPLSIIPEFESVQRE
jgi:hypothetical protein